MNKKALIVDDSKTIRTLITKFLEKHMIDAVEASDGNEGFEVFSLTPNDFSVIFTDVNMPFVSGLEMLEQIKESFPDHQVPVVIVSSESSADWLEKVKNLKVRMWVTKPLQAGKLDLVIQKLFPQQNP